MIGKPYFKFRTMSLIKNVPKVSIAAIRKGNSMAPQRANAASGELLASASAIAASENAGIRRTETKQTRSMMT